MGFQNESSVGNKYYLEIDWGVPKRIYLSKFYFGSQASQVLDINGQTYIPQNPVYVYPADTYNVESSPIGITLREFYFSGSLFPRSSIGAEVSLGKELKRITSYQFQNVKILQLFGWGADRFSWFYSFQFDKWS